MANPGYVRSTDGNNADDGSTWDLANATMAGAITDAVAGDRIWVSDNHAESTAGSLTLTFPGTLAAPNQVLCGDDAAEPPTALATTGTIAATGSVSIAIGGIVLWDGPGLLCGSAASSASITLAATDGSFTHIRNSLLHLNNTNTGSRIIVSTATSGTEGFALVENCTIRFGSTSQFWVVHKRAILRGVSFHASSSAITTFCASATNADLLVEGSDLAGGAAGMFLLGGSGLAGFMGTYRNCKLPASWSGTLFNGSPAQYGCRGAMHNCNAGDVHYSLWEEDLAGSVRDETTLVRSGSSTDGATNVSWRVATTSTAQFPELPFVCPEIRIWNETVGSSVTIAIPFQHDDTTDAKTNEIGMDIHYQGTSGNPKSLMASTDESIISASFANHADATATDAWDGTGLTNQNEQRMSLTVTPQERGWFIIVPKVYEASKTFYIDPDPQIS